MSAIRTHHLFAVATASTGLLLPVGAARGTDDGFIYSGYPRTEATRPVPRVGIGVHRRDSLSIFGHCDDPHSLETRRRFGRVSEDQYHYDPYGYRDDLGFYARSYLDRDDGVSTRLPVSSDVPCSLSSVSARGQSEKSNAYPSRPSISRTFTPDFLVGEGSFDEILAEIYEASGWTPLADGRTDDAYLRFSKLSKRRPARGVPRVGLALASAVLGDRDRAVILMREALRVDGSALDHVPVDDRLRERLAALARRYPTTEFSEDTHFMRAALDYLRGKNEAAHTSIERALARGDDDESTAVLRRIIVDRSARSLRETALPPENRTW